MKLNFPDIVHVSDDVHDYYEMRGKKCSNVKDVIISTSSITAGTCSIVSGTLVQCDASLSTSSDFVPSRQPVRWEFDVPSGINIKPTASSFDPIKLSPFSSNAKSKSIPSKKKLANCYDHILSPAAYRALPQLVEHSLFQCILPRLRLVQDC